MCTSLIYSDSNEHPYLGRTLELDTDEPWVITYVPAGISFESPNDDPEPFRYTASHGFLAVTAPGRMPTQDAPLKPDDLKVIEGVNTAGLTFSLLAFPSSGGGSDVKPVDAIQATDLGSWILAQFSTVGEVKAALAEQPVVLTRIAIIGDAEFPFHLVVHDREGGSIVIEWFKGEEHVYDNPVGVMTNGPTFPWHLTNLSNWTHLTNVDQSSNQFGSLSVHQPDSGIATASLPGSNTSVGRFIRAVFYANFAEKVDDADGALLTLARIMDNFDRPRGATVSPPADGGEGIAFQGITDNKGGLPTEFTCWTNLTDLDRQRFYLRTYGSFNYTSFDLVKLSASKEPRAILASTLDAPGGDGTDALLAGMSV